MLSTPTSLQYVPDVMPNNALRAAVPAVFTRRCASVARRILLLAALLFAGGFAQGQQPAVSPFDYGLREAQSDTARYTALLRAHNAAVSAGVDVDYTGIDSLYIEVPHGAPTIPLTRHNDFKGCTFFVLNREKDNALFGMTQPTPRIALDKALVDQGDFGGMEALNKGWMLLILYDRHPWVAQRIGYGYPFERRDVLLLHDGKAVNNVVASYNTDSTALEAYFCKVDTIRKTIENITIVRDKRCTYKSYCFNIIGQDNVLLRNISITTPKSRLTADGAIIAQNATRIALEDVTIDGTYSAPQKYGSGVSMNNVWCASFTRLKADGKWGVFGTNNMSGTLLRECDVNRFDIHCYGRDARFIGCTFRGKQTQFSSMYGTVVFDSCLFADCIPVRIRASYNAYTPFDIVMRNCSFDATRRHHALVNVMLLDTALNARPELAEKCWPNLRVENLTVNILSGPRRLDLYEPTGTLSECSKPVAYISKVQVDTLAMLRKGKPAEATLHVFSHPVATKGIVEQAVDNISGVAKVEFGIPKEQ